MLKILTFFGFLLSVPFLLFGFFGICATFGNPAETWEIEAMSGNLYLDFFGGRDGSPERTENEVFFYRLLPISIFILGIVIPIGFLFAARKFSSTETKILDSTPSV